MIRKAWAKWRSERGLTLMEMVIAVGLITMSAAMVGAPMFSVIQVNEDWRQTLTATANWRQAAGLLSRDAGPAKGVSLEDEESISLDEDTLTLVRADGEVVYSLADGVLLRTKGSASMAVARGVASVEYTRQGNLLFMEMTMAQTGKTVLARAALQGLEDPE